MEKNKNNIIENFLSHLGDRDIFLDKTIVLEYLLSNFKTKKIKRETLLDKYSSRQYLFINEFNNLDGRYSLDETLALASNASVTAAYDYLWHREGKNIRIGNEAMSRDTVSDLELKIQRAVTNDSQFNIAIRNVLKNGLDYGIGCLFYENHVFRSVQPSSFLTGSKFGETFIIIETFKKISNKVRNILTLFINCTDNIITYIKEISGVILKKSSGVCAMSFWFDDEIKFLSEEYYDVSPVHMFLPMIFGSTIDNPIGSGTLSVSSTLQLQKLAFDVIMSQRMEIMPKYGVLSNSVSDVESVHLSPATLMDYSPTENNGEPPIRALTAPRAGNAHIYLESWRSVIRANYNPETSLTRGVGQTTASEAEASRASAKGYLTALTTPFLTWFMHGVIKKYIKDMDLNKNERLIMKDAEITFIGKSASDLISSTIEGSMAIKQLLEIFGREDIPLLVDNKKVAEEAIRDFYPSHFRTTKAEYDRGMEELQRKYAVEQMNQNDILKQQLKAKNNVQ